MKRFVTSILLLLFALTSFGQYGTIAATSNNRASSPWWLGGGTIPASTGYTVYDPLSAGTLAESYINLANPGTRNATAPTAAPTHAQGSGWTFNGTTQYLNTQTLVVNEQTVIVWVENSAGVYCLGGYTNSGGVKGMMFDNTNSTATTFFRGTNQTGFAGVTIGGILGLSKNNSFKNGVSASSPGTISATSLAIYLGCHNQNGTAISFFSGRILRLAIYNTTLTTQQIESVTQTMFDYHQPPNDPYINTVLALNPICYYPCNQAYGSVLFDISGNNAHGESYNLPVGQPGLYGNSIAGDGLLNNCTRTVPGWATLTGLNMNEFSFACWLKVDHVFANQIRVINCWSNNITEFFALEIRNGNDIALYTLVNGVAQNSGGFAFIGDEVWTHVVVYNSLSQMKYGAYIDGVKYEFTKTTGSFVDTSPDDTFPWSIQDTAGNIQHIAYFNHALSQSEVNTLLNP